MIVVNVNPRPVFTAACFGRRPPVYARTAETKVVRAGTMRYYL